METGSASDQKVESPESIDQKYAITRLEAMDVSPEEEARLRRIFDWNLLPPLAFMYLCNALDKGNVGNAKTDGWDKVFLLHIASGTEEAHTSQDIHLTGNQYYLLVMVFYVPFCLFGTPISILVKRFSASRILPLMMIGFGSMSLLAGAAKNFEEIFAIRFFLGIFESPMLPGVVFYLSTFYKRDELASRVGLFYAAASISGAFSGGGSVCFAIFAWFWLPKSPSTWKKLTERQKAIANARILADSSVVANEELNIRDAFRPFADPMYWVWALISLSFGVPLASVNNFLPQIVASLGYSTVRTNLLTVAPNIAGTVALLLLTFSSDHFRERSMHICIALAIGLTGFIILGSIDPLAHRGVAYFACFLLTSGAFAPSVLVSAWYSNNTPQESRRAVVAAVMGSLLAIANSAGLISTNVFRAQDEPKYVPALATSGMWLDKVTADLPLNHLVSWVWRIMSSPSCKYWNIHEN
ncbi:hypothetical protein CVT26_008959 [Gymnopilus dilepis]|uniref:Major facilitator superfamily (MFS) profile domain-containing protein n=1 Tax=Gymnopilus dilepis TaxID=231916 RepID=A0A409YRU7_9AGAR|nr:hypothetical protein CVT26_008959 [Gymnopilus dilepis]